MNEVSRRWLRDGLQASLSGNSPGCLDAETVARWADDTLSRNERAAVETHAAGCARCLALVAVLERTAPIAPRSWFRWSIVGWVAPLTAAAALLVWIALPSSSRSPAQTNARLEANAGAPSAPPAVGSRDEARERDERERSFGSASTQRLPTRSAQPPPRSGLGFRLESEEAARRSGQAPRLGSGQAPRLGSGQADKKVEAPAETAKAAAADALRPAAPAAPDSAAPAAPAPPAPPTAPGSAGQRAAIGGLRESALARSERALMFDADRQPPALTIPSSVPGTLWRVAPGPVVLRTTDGGATWDTQDIGVSVQPAAGASPSPLVCWLVGPRGLVLLSTDARSWKRIAFSETVDLTVVRAVDGKTATVTTSDGRTYTTNDGGATWVRR